MEDSIDRTFSLPPGFTLRPMVHALWDEALQAARADEPGTVVWDGAGGRCRAAFVFAPDRAMDAAILRDLGLLALFDAIALLAPPKSPVTITPPAALSVDGGRVATVRAEASPGPIPDWAVLAIDVAIHLKDPAPGDRPHQTCLAEEGFGPLAPEDVLEPMSRHLLAWIDAWRDEGAGLLARTIQQRTLALAL